MKNISTQLISATTDNIYDIILDLQKYGLKIYEKNEEWQPTSSNSNGVKMVATDNSIIVSFYTKNQKALTKEYAITLNCSYWKYNLMVEINKIPYLFHKLSADYQSKKIIPESFKGPGKGTTGILSLLRIREKGLPDFTFSHHKINLISYKRSGEPSVNECIKEVLRFLKVDENVIKEVNILQDTLPILKQLPPVEQKENLRDLFPDLEKEWHFEKNHPFNPQHFKAKSNFKVWWRCENGHDFDSKIISRTKGHGCRFCTRNGVTKENSLAHLYPSIASEWDYDMNGELTPENVSAHSNSEVFWKCPNCHSSYDNSVNERTGKGENCPYCAGKRVNDTNSLASLRPDLAEEWHPTENEKQPNEVPLGSHYLATWICKREHSYPSYVYSRVEGRGCPKCYEESGRYQPHKISFDKSIAKKKTFLMKQWDYEKNEMLPEETPAYARQKIWWKCSKGCSWEQEPNARNSSRCKNCRVKD